MVDRAKTGGRTIKARRRKAAKASRPASAPRSSPAVDLQRQLDQRTRELAEAREQQTATAEVLRVISSSPGDLKPVFDAMLESATRLCEAKFGVLFRAGDGKVQADAIYNMPKEAAEFITRRGAFSPAPGGVLHQLIEGNSKPIQSDVVEDMAGARAIRMAGGRSRVAVPMRKGGKLVGAIVIYRQEVRPFTEKHIELVQNFAAQAVIAIENARLLNELRQRTDDLSESLEQQTATAEVLKVISGSPGELKPVFEAMLANAVRICDAKFGTLFQFDGEFFHRVAGTGIPPALVEFQERRGPFKAETNKRLNRLLQSKTVFQVADEAADPAPSRTAQLGGARTIVAVPMLKDDDLVGAINIYRQEVRPFTDKQIALVQNFASQAVIAIENARLLSELREALEQQTATADVLKVISRSAFNLQTVLQTLVESAARLCRADRSSIRLLRDGRYHHLASHGYPAEHTAYMRNNPITPSRESVVGRVVLESKVIHITDFQKEPGLTYLQAPGVEWVGAGLGVPLLREGRPIGTLLLMKTTIEPFADKQIELATTFADQAVIAIENVRLFDEIQEKSRQLAEASQHKSQFLANMSHELRTPLNAILGYTELILDGIYGETPEKAQAVLKRVESNGRHLLALINDVLDLSKIEAGQLKLTLTDYSIKDVVNGVFSALEPLATKKNLNLKVAVPDNVPGARGDERKLTQVLLNLVGNAIKFTDEGEVAINVAAENGSLNIAIRDTGPGIAPADQARLFEEFQQADNSITKTKGGTGLGLAISKRIIEMHGGQILLESAVGRGSTFKVALPLHVERQVSVS